MNHDLIYRGNLDHNNDKGFPSTHDHPVMKKMTEKCLSEVSFISDDQTPSPIIQSKNEENMKRELVRNQTR